MGKTLGTSALVSYRCIAPFFSFFFFFLIFFLLLLMLSFLVLVVVFVFLAGTERVTLL